MKEQSYIEYQQIDTNHDAQQMSLLSHLQLTGSFRQIGQIIAPQPTHVLSDLLQAQ